MIYLITKLSNNFTIFIGFNDVQSKEKNNTDLYKVGITSKKKKPTQNNILDCAWKHNILLPRTFQELFPSQTYQEWNVLNLQQNEWTKPKAIWPVTDTGEHTHAK